MAIVPIGGSGRGGGGPVLNENIIDVSADYVSNGTEDVIRVSGSHNIKLPQTATKRVTIKAIDATVFVYDFFDILITSITASQSREFTLHSSGWVTV